MKIYLSVITFLIFHCSFAQITITDNDLISVGDIIEQVDDISPNSAINVGSPGANQFWDFSSLQIVGSYTQQCIDPSTTPFSISYPNSNLCMYDGIEHVFLNKTPSKIELLGIDDSVFADPVVVLPLPLSYGTSLIDGPVTFVDSSISGPFVELILATYGFSAALISGSAAHVADTISVSGDIETEFLVDAYGTMQLPMGSYDCLRLKIERNSTTNIQVHCIDTISGSGTGWYQIPFSDFEEDISYQWWTNNPDSRFFLAEAYVDSSDNVLDVTFTNNSSSFSNNQLKSNFSVQLVDDKSIEISASSNISSNSFKIYDVSGRLVQENSFSNNITIDTKFFKKGTYIMNFYTNENIVESKKILVQ